MNPFEKTLSITLAVVILISTSCKSGGKDEKAVDKSSPISVSEMSAPFTQSFSQLLNSYYELTEGFVSGDSVKINASAASVQLHAGNLKLAEIAGDTTGTIRETAALFAATITSSATALAGEKEIDQKLREFNMISDALWNLTRTVRYSDQKIYYQFCSEAFENTGGYWLSNSREVANPYTGNKTPDCGEVTDSVDYSKK